MADTLLQRVRRVIGEVSHRDWRFVAEWLRGPEVGAVAIQAQFPRADRETGQIGYGQSRWELIAPDASDDAIIKTCFVLVKLTVEHEAMEWFKYCGVRIFDPHTPVSDLVSMQQAREWFNQGKGLE